MVIDMDPGSYEKTKEKRVDRNSSKIMQNLAKVLREKSQENFKKLVKDGVRLSHTDIRTLNPEFKKIYQDMIISDANY